MKTYTDDALARTIYQLAAQRMQAAGQQIPRGNEDDGGDDEADDGIDDGPACRGDDDA